MFQVIDFNLDAQIPRYSSSAEGGGIRPAPELSTHAGQLPNVPQSSGCFFREGILRPSCDTLHIFNSSPSCRFRCWALGVQP
jgi:hypothetical protein